MRANAELSEKERVLSDQVDTLTTDKAGLSDGQGRALRRARLHSPGGHARRDRPDKAHPHPVEGVEAGREAARQRVPLPRPAEQEPDPDAHREALAPPGAAAHRVDAVGRLPAGSQPVKWLGRGFEAKESCALREGPALRLLQ